MLLFGAERGRGWLHEGDESVLYKLRPLVSKATLSVNAR